MLVGTSNRPAATEFAFLVGIPTMYAASAYEIYGQFKQGGGHEDGTGLAVAFVVSIITAFAIYRMLFGAALLMAAALGWVA